jgi:hypothetical protein
VLQIQKSALGSAAETGEFLDHRTRPLGKPVEGGNRKSLAAPHDLDREK